jgi:hypothetical protein
MTTYIFYVSFFAVGHFFRQKINLDLIFMYCLMCCFVQVRILVSYIKGITQEGGV